MKHGFLYTSFFYLLMNSASFPIRWLLSALLLVVGVAFGGQAQYRPTAPGDINWDDRFAPTADGLGGEVRALVVLPDSSVVVGGSFLQAGGDTAIRYLARWNGSVWQQFGTRLRGRVTALTLDAATGKLLAAGRSSGRYGYIARWSGSFWTYYENTQIPGPYGGANALAVLTNGKMVAGGRNFQGNDDPDSESLAWWSGAWNYAGLPFGYGTVSALCALAGGEVAVGGKLNLPSAPNVGVLNSQNRQWRSLAGGLNGAVYALALAPNGDLISGGKFTNVANNPAANYLARWDGTAWQPLGIGLNDSVTAIAVAPNGDVVVGGGFTSAAGNPAVAHIGRWNGTSWAPLGSGLNQLVRSVAVRGGDVLAGGAFTSVGDGSKPVAHFGIYRSVVAPTGIRPEAALSAGALLVWPNPASGTVRVTGAPASQSLRLTDATGRLVRALPSGATTLDVRGLAPSVYVLRCGPLAQRLVVE